MRIIKMVFLLVILLTLSGCYNYKEINEYAIVSAVSIDKSKKDNKKYTVGIQIMNAKKDEESDTSSIAFYKTDGNTIYECLQKMTLSLPKELYLGHNEVVLISEDLLKKESALNYLDYFLRDSEVEKDSLVIIAKETNAYDVLKIITPLETIPSRNLKETIKVTDDYKGTLSTITLDEFVSKLSNNGEDTILPSVKISGKTTKGKKNENISQSDPEAKLKLSTYGFFEKGRLKGYLTNEEEQGFKLLSNNANGTFVNVKCDSKNYATIRIKKTSSKEKLSFNKNIASVKIKNKVNSVLVEYNCKADFLKSKKYINSFEKKTQRKIDKLITKTLNKLYKENKSDALSYGEKFYSKKNKDLKKLNIKENDIKDNISFSVKSNVKIDRIGLTIKSIREVSTIE